jgi:putative transposase
VKPAQQRAVVGFFRAGFRVSERRACRVAGVPRSTCRYRSVARDQTALRGRLRELAAARVRYGYRRLHVLLRREGWPVNHKRIHRLYREEGLSIRVKPRRKRVSGGRVLPRPAQRPQERWSMDFLTDSLLDGRRFRVLTIVDNVSRVSPAIAVGRSLTGERVVAVLERLKETIGVPQRIGIDNGPEFISKALDAWAYRNGVRLEFSRPGKPTDNAFAESFNGRFRDECLNQHWFASLEEARQTIEAWRVEYNTERPHRALGQQTPAAWEAGWKPLAEAAD